LPSHRDAETSKQGDQNALQNLQGVSFLAVDLQIHVSARPGARMLFFDGSDDLGSFLCRQFAYRN
jgi:hypothetical protein